ncbi:MAG: DUF4411 family protein [Oscillospiraceae bacterium]
MVALAKQKQCKVVTEETPTRNEKAPKIPDVYNLYQVKCIDFVKFAR